MRPLFRVPEVETAILTGNNMGDIPYNAHFFPLDVIMT